MTFPVPLGYEGYVASLDVSGLTGEDYEAARALLLRGRSLDPRVRYDLARQLGTTVAGRMRHSPPPGIGPDLFLACVAAAFQQRFGAATGPPAGPSTPPPMASPMAPAAAPPPSDEQWGAVAPQPPRPSDGHAQGDGFAPPA